MFYNPTFLDCSPADIFGGFCPPPIFSAAANLLPAIFGDCRFLPDNSGVSAFFPLILSAISHFAADNIGDNQFSAR